MKYIIIKNVYKHICDTRKHTHLRLYIYICVCVCVCVCMCVCVCVLVVYHFAHNFFNQHYPQAKLASNQSLASMTKKKFYGTYRIYVLSQLAQNLCKQLLSLKLNHACLLKQPKSCLFCKLLAGLRRANKPMKYCSKLSD
jgi:hypothetical protein